MKSILFTVCTILALQKCAGHLESEWTQFKIDYQKNYSILENSFRKEVFAKTYQKIAEHQEKFKNGQVSYELGINEFADMTDIEYADKLKRSVFGIEMGRSAPYQNFSQRSAPSSINWVEYGYKNPVLNQGNCGSCYVFAGVAALEAQYFIKHKELVQLAHQELLDCGKEYGNYGCGGGWQKNMYEYMLGENGVGHESSNPYTAKEGTCKRGDPRITINKYFEIPSGDEEALKLAVANVGPIPIDMDASPNTFRNYKSGVFYDEDCSPNYLSHAITVVGYGTTEKGEDYWLVRNSWGFNWGDKGHILMARNRNNNCGVATRAVYPIVD